MRTLAYIELDTHAEVVSDFMSLIQDSRIFNVDYYFSEKIAAKLHHTKGRILVTSADKLLSKLKGKQYDFVILGTAHRYFNVFIQLVKQYPTYIIAHNINFVKASNAALLRNVFKKEWRYRTKLWLREGLLAKNNVYEGAKGLLVLDDNIVAQHPDLKLQLLPVYFRKFFSDKTSQNYVVIPGTVDQHRRNYSRIFKKALHFKQNFTLVFLGAGKEQQRLISAKNKTPKNVRLKYYNEHVDSEEFTREMLKASVLWCPIREETEFFSITEYYGKTKISGNIGDAITYGKPAIFPKSYTNYYSFVFKEERDIEEQILNLPNQSYDFTNFEKTLVLQELESVLASLNPIE